ncbi:G2E3 ligase, partial [Smithornis capensis]|nr:G2E3 ligase [Smithornis capensis]
EGLLCSFQPCFICSKMGATITCWEKECDRSFHLPCAPQGECVTQFFGLYRSFCWEHRPQQAVRACPRQKNTCCICLDSVEDKTSYKTMVCPACQDAHFHRHCIQRLALHAGICFHCPCCQNQELFVMEMLTMGIRVSKRLFFLFPTHKCQAQVRGQLRDCLRRAGHLLSWASCPQLHGRAGNGAGKGAGT